MLRVEDLSIWFEDRGTLEKVVKGISFSMDSGEILGIVGESGSGKTMTALTIAGILKKNARIESGKIAFEGKELLSLTGKELRDSGDGQLCDVVTSHNRTIAECPRAVGEVG